MTYNSELWMAPSDTWWLIDPPRYGGEAIDVLRQLGFTMPMSIAADGGVLAAHPEDRVYYCFERDGMSAGDAAQVASWLEAKGLPPNLPALSMLNMRVLSTAVGLVSASAIWGAQEGQRRYANLRHLLETGSLPPRDLRAWELFQVMRVNGADERHVTSNTNVANRLVNSHHSVYRSGSGVPLQPDDIAKWILRHPDVGALFQGVLHVDPKDGTNLPRHRGGRRPPRDSRCVR